MNPVLLQKQLKDNAADLQDFYNDLKAWGTDMKRKEESLQKPKVDNALTGDKKRKIVSNTKELSEKVKPQKSKVGVTDYAAWDKFDAEAECEKVDYNENEESDLTDEYDDSSRDQAYLEKEKGNKFVKEKKWDEAIVCYTKAIKYYSYDPVFYANRALCHLKKNAFSDAETDCTRSIKLDETYVKAYLRRAAAKEALKKLEEAESDLLKVLELEPKNTEVKANLNNLRKRLVKTEKVEENVAARPVSKFTMSRNKMGIKSLTGDKSNNNNNELKSESSSVTNKWPSDENIILVKTVNKPAHLQSKKPLKRVEIKEIVELIGNDGNEGEASKPFPRTEQHKVSFKTDDLHVVEKQPVNSNINEKLKEDKNNTNNMKMNETHIDWTPPSNSVQFYSNWRHLKTLENKYTYLKLIKPEELPNIFKESLESGVFSQILEVLVKCFVKNGDKVYNYLAEFSKIRRFSTIIMFMSENDKIYARKLFDYVKICNEHHLEENIEDLFNKYEL